MDENEFPPNSRTAPARSPQKAPSRGKEDPADKDIKPIVSAEGARTRKKSLGKRFTENFVQGDAHSVWSYVTFDVMLPAAKDMVADAVSQGVERMIFGESRSSNRRSGGRNRDAGHVNYNKMSQRPDRRDEPRAISTRSRATHNFDEIEISSRAEAEEVIDRLFELIDRYELVTVAELYQMVNLAPEFTDEKYGWEDMRGARVERARNGYYQLRLPRPVALD